MWSMQTNRHERARTSGKKETPTKQVATEEEDECWDEEQDDASDDANAASFTVATDLGPGTSPEGFEIVPDKKSPRPEVDIPV